MEQKNTYLSLSQFWVMIKWETTTIILFLFEDLMTIQSGEWNTAFVSLCIIVHV